MISLHLLKTSIGASWALRQTAELVKLGVKVHVALPSGPMVEKYQQAGVIVHLFDPALELRKPWRNFRKARELRDMVAKIQPDFVHSHFVATTLLMRLALRKVRVKKIFHVPGPLHLEHKLFRTVDLFTAGSQDYWLASCLWTKQKYLSCGIVENKVGLAYYGVNEDDFSFENEDKAEFRKQLDIESEAFVLGMVAYFYPPKGYLGQKRGLKGHEDLIDAVAIVAQSHPNVKCIFVGGPWGDSQQYYQQVKAYADAKQTNCFIFLGHRTDVPRLYPQFDLAVHPSHSENVGGAVESMYAKVATLTSNVGGFPDLVENGVTGYMASAKDPKDLAAKIIEAMSDTSERNARITRASKRVSEVMNVQHNAQQVYQFYQYILKENGKPNNAKTTL